MATNNGAPSGANKSDKGTGIPSNISADNMNEDNRLTEEYTVNDEEIADNLRVENPNRNTDKEDATNAGGYRN